MGATRDRVRQALATKSIPDAALDILDTLHEVLVTSRTVYMLRHYLFESQRLYLDACLLSGEEAGFLKETLNAEWQNRLRHFDGQAARIEKQATGAGIPLVAVLVPYRAQASVSGPRVSTPINWMTSYAPSSPVMEGPTSTYCPASATYPTLSSITSRWMDIPLPRGTQSSPGS